MQLPSSSPWMGWSGIAAIVLLYDVISIKQGTVTLSESYYRSLRSRPFSTSLVTLYLLGHLSRTPSFLAKIDPLSNLATIYRKANSRVVLSAVQLPEVPLDLT